MTLTIPLLAHMALVRFLVRVNTHVGFQSTRFTKTFLAHITFERFLVRVNTRVLLQIIRCTKTLLAHITFVRPLVRVNTLVSFQMTRCTKSFIAHITFVRSLVRVNTHVGFQTTRLSKTLLANIALVLPSLPLRSFLNKSRFFFLYLMMIRLENVRNSQTQHQRFFFLHFFFFSRHLQNRPRVHRALRMWILSSHVIISSSNACVACGVGSVFSPK